MDSARLHAFGWDGPDGRLRVDLIPGRAKNLTGAGRCEYRELECQCAHRVVLADLLDELGNLLVGQRRVVPAGNLRTLGQQLVQVPPPEGRIRAMPESLGPGRIQDVLDPTPQASRRLG